MATSVEALAILRQQTALSPETASLGEYQRQLLDGVIASFQHSRDDGFTYHSPSSWSPETRRLIAARMPTLTPARAKLVAVLATVQAEVTDPMVNPHRQERGAKDCQTAERLAAHIAKGDSFVNMALSYARFQATNLPGNSLEAIRFSVRYLWEKLEESNLPPEFAQIIADLTSQPLLKNFLAPNQPLAMAASQGGGAPSRSRGDNSYPGHDDSGSGGGGCRC